MKNKSAKTAAVFYVLWGIIHIIGGAALLSASMDGADAFVKGLTGNTGAALNGVIGGGLLGLKAAKWVFAFHSYNIMWMGILAILIAVLMNWKDSTAGYWINMAVVGFADLGLIIFMVLPGVMSISNAWIGPLLFLLAFSFSTIGRLTKVKD